jgi:AraC-like DNA-binding protein
MSSYLVRPTIPARYLAELLERSGVDVPSALKAAGLPPGAHVLPRFRASAEQVVRLYSVVRRMCGDELFGFMRRTVPPGTYAVAMRFATGCAHPLEFIESATRLYALFDEGHRYWRVTRQGRVATLAVDFREPSQEKSIFFVHSMLLTPWRSAVWLVGQPIPLTSVRIDPAFRDLRGETIFLFGREPSFARGAAEISFDARWLDAPIVRAPGDADAYAKTSLARLLSAPGGDTLEGRVRRELTGLTSSEGATLPEIAARLRISRATLARQLRARGLSFQEIKDELRRDRAIALLEAGAASVAEISDVLGFSEPSAFTRAFKSWTGVAPGRYRPR